MIFLLFFTIACSSTVENAPPVVDRVDLQKYLGRWYQLAYFPNSFQDEDCRLVTADYSQKPEDDEIKVINTCWANKEGTEVQDRAEGKAWVVDKKTNAKLKVQFFWPFSGDYHIIMLANDYSYAVVSNPSKEYLWILTREPQMQQQQFKPIETRLRKFGFSLDRLVITASIIE